MQPLESEAHVHLKINYGLVDTNGAKQTTLFTIQYNTIRDHLSVSQQRELR